MPAGEGREEEITSRRRAEWCFKYQRHRAPAHARPDRSPSQWKRKFVALHPDGDPVGGLAWVGARSFQDDDGGVHHRHSRHCLAGGAVGLVRRDFSFAAYLAAGRAGAALWKSMERGKRGAMAATR